MWRFKFYPPLSPPYFTSGFGDMEFLIEAQKLFEKMTLEERSKFLESLLAEGWPGTYVDKSDQRKAREAQWMIYDQLLANED